MCLRSFGIFKKKSQNNNYNKKNVDKWTNTIKL